MDIILLLILVLIINYIYKLCKNETFTDLQTLDELAIEYSLYKASHWHDYARY